MALTGKISDMLPSPEVKESLADTDPLWHLAAGDLTRELGRVPAQDPWAFTTENYRWLNISWGWDSLLSFTHEHLGWHGAAALNAITIAATMLLIFTWCALRSGQLFLSLVALGLVMPMMVINLRPLQVTSIMVAGWLLLLGCVARRKISARWLALLPLLTIIWVNSHGGFLLAPMFVGAYFLQALFMRDYRLARQLFFTGIAVCAALLVNPYHFYILEAAWRPLHDQAALFITEWQPFSASSTDLLKAVGMIMFIALCRRRPHGILPVEFLLAYAWLFMGLLSRRHMIIFAIFCAAPLACGLHALWVQLFPRHAHSLNNVAARYNSKYVAGSVAALCLIAACWLPTASAAKIYGQEKIALPSLKAETEFLTTHHPKARLLSHFDIAAILVYETRGKVPVFLDPRTETAFPPQVIEDYIGFLFARPGWEHIFDTYQMDGVMLPNDDQQTLARFEQRRGWKKSFEGPTATIFMKEQ